MATTYTETVDVKVWKQHECARCGASFRYLFKRRKTGQGKTPAAAIRAANQAVVKALKFEVDMQPCPGCGLYQPDMIAPRQARAHWWTFAPSVPVFLLLLLLVTSASSGSAFGADLGKLLPDLLVFRTAALIAAALAGIFTLAHLVIDAINPNSNLDANLKLAHKRVRARKLWVVREDTRQPPETQIGRGITGVHALCYLLLLTGVLAFLVPEAVRLHGGMIGNPGWYPEVVGPGEEACVYFPGTINSIKWMWHGAVQATVENAPEVGEAAQPAGPAKQLRPAPPVHLAARAKADNWGGTIKIDSSTERNTRTRLWAYVRLPDDPSLAGKALRLRIDMDVVYPVSADFLGWEEKTEHRTETATLNVSAGRAAATYVQAWWFGFLAGILLMLLSGALLAVASRAYRKKALPTRTYSPEDADDEAEEEDRPRDRGKRRRRDRDDTRTDSNEEGHLRSRPRDRDDRDKDPDDRDDRPRR